MFQACEYYSRALELDPEDESVVLNRAITRTLLRKVPEALQDFSLALELSPYSAHVYFNRANLYCSLRQYSHAEKDLTEGSSSPLLCLSLLQSLLTLTPTVPPRLYKTVSYGTYEVIAFAASM